jgi:hypothetical protein
MTDAQLSLLKDLIDADRKYRTAVHNGDHSYEMNWRGVEVGGACSQHKMRTAISLANLGLCEIMDLFGNATRFAFLSKFDPYDAVENDS